MALTPPALYGALLAAKSSGVFPFGGVVFPRFALGLATGVAQWAVVPSNVALAGASTGVLGMGNVLAPATKVTIPPTVSVMTAGLKGAGMVGPLSQSLAIVVTQGLAQGMSASAQYTGASLGVGVGADVSKVISANSASLAGILKQTLSASMGAGAALLQMVQGLSVGISGLVLLGTGIGTVVGAPIFPFPPSVGATLSVMV